MVAYYFSFKTALVKGSPNVVSPNTSVLIYDVADVNRATPVTAYSNPGLTTIVNLVSDAYGIVPDFYTNNRADVLWKSGVHVGQWATSQSRPGITGPAGPIGPQGVQGVQGNPGLNGAGSNADVAAYVSTSGATRTALDARYVPANNLDTLTAAKVNDTGSQTRAALDAKYEVKGAGAGTLQSLRGLYAARPVATTVPNGSLYYATDVQEAYRANGSVWQVQGSGGNSLGYAETSTDFVTSAAAGSKADIPGLSVTFTAGERPVEVRFGGLLIASGSTTGVYVGLVLGGAVKAEVGDVLRAGFLSVERGKPVSGLTPGQTYTFKATAGSSPAASVTVSGAATNPAWISVVNR